MGNINLKLLLPLIDSLWKNKLGILGYPTNFPNIEIDGADCARGLPGSFIFKEMISAPPVSHTKYERLVNEWIKSCDLTIPTSEPKTKKYHLYMHQKNYYF